MPRAILATLAALAATLASTATAAGADTARVARLFDSLRTQPAPLRTFLRAMPKGGDLHNHLWGAPYAEDFLAAADEAGFCVMKDGSALARPPCGTDAVPAAGLARRDPVLYSTAVNSLSMRGYVTGTGASAIEGHDRFFATFARFAPVASAMPGHALATARRLAANDHVSYLETQSDPAAVLEAGALALSLKVPADDPAAAFVTLAPRLPSLLAAARTETDRMEQDAARRLGCTGAVPPAPCAVTVRFQAYGLRSAPPEAVFGQLALAFALVDADPRYVGVNLVAPEDGPVALADYDRHMAMLRFLSQLYPKVPMSLHAGELSLGLVPPAALAGHIAKAVATGARRIGHGVDISYEADAPATLVRMARERIAVEINLTSNDSILGVRGADHPLALYRAAGVPVVLSTDDEGVSRSDMTNEYLRAATEQGLDYADLKSMARASISYAFLAGESLWSTAAIGTMGAACRAADPAGPPPPPCAALIARSDKARAEWRLEQAFAAFEAVIGKTQF